MLFMLVIPNPILFLYLTKLLDEATALQQISFMILLKNPLGILTSLIVQYFDSLDGSLVHLFNGNDINKARCCLTYHGLPKQVLESLDLAGVLHS